MVAVALLQPVAIDPHVVMTVVPVIPRCPDEPRTRGGGDDDSRLRGGDFNVDYGSTSERNHRQGTQ
jgi:hypothetical protein